MFKNPLKYASGGSLSQEQEIENQLVNAIAEDLGAQPEEVKARLEQIKADPNETKELRRALQLMQTDRKNGIAAILNLFAGKKAQSAKLGGKIQDFICKHGKGGNIDCGCAQKAQNGGLVRAKSYYANHANEGIIRKIQTFLASRNYDLGDAGIDGKFGQSTYEAIKQYQRDNGLVDDGMWGEDTNMVHRVLGAGDTTFNGNRSGAHSGTHTYTNQFKGQKSYATPEQEDAYLRNVTNRAYNDANWFWGDSADANAARDFLYSRNGGNEFIQDIYENYTSPELQQRIAYSKLPVNIQQQRYNQGISDYVSDAGKTGAKVGAAIGASMLAAEAVPYLIDAVPEMANGLKGIWNPAQARTGTFFNRIPNGSVTSNLNGQFVSNAGMNMGQFTSGTDYAATIANNLRMLKPYGFKNGGKVEKHQQENGKGRGILGGLSNLYNRFIGQRMPDTLDARDRRLKMWVDQNGVQHFVEDANVNGNFTTTSFDVYQPGDTSGVKQKITTGDGRYRMVNLQPGTPEWRTVISRNVQEQEKGGKVEKAQPWQRPMYAKCGKKIKKGQFGIAGMPINPKVVKAVYDKVDNFLTPANKWEKEHGTSVIGGLGLPAYVSPVAQEIELAKIIGNRIPTQASAEKNMYALAKADAEQKKAIKAGEKIVKRDIGFRKRLAEHDAEFRKTPADWDVDLSMFDSKFNVPDLNNIIKFGWPEFIGRNVLLPASGVIGSAAAGSYMATKNDKNKKSENK